MPETSEKRKITFRTWLLAVPPLLILPFVVPIPEALDKIYVVRTFGSLFHFVLPGLLVAFFHRFGRFRGRLLPSVLLAFALSAGAEIAQSLVGRHPRLIDAGVDLSGALFAAGVISYRGGRPRAVYIPLLLFLAAVPWLFWKVPGNIVARRDAADRFPLIADFDTRTDRVLWDLGSNGGGRFGFADRRDGPGQVICIFGGPRDPWPGVAMHGIPRDWSGWDKLVFEAVIAEGGPARLAVRLDDYQGIKEKTWCVTRVDLDRTWRRYEIDLRDLAAGLESRIFRLDDLSLLVLYLVDVETDVTVCIDNMTLEMDSPPTGGDE